MHLAVTDTELKHLDWFLGFSQDIYVLQNKVKNVFCHFSLFSLPRTCMKTCRLSASSFVSPRQFLRAVLCKYRLSSFGREKMKSLKLSQKNGLYK